MNEMINSLTSILPLLTIDGKNSLYYNSSVFCFSVIAVTNHILPENLDGFTHVVKMLFSNLLFALVGVNPLFGFILSLVDLTPLFSENPKMKKIGESLLQIPRLLIEMLLMYRIFEEHKWEVIVMIICKVIYYFERKARIKKGIRNDFGSWHSAEHCGLYLLFKCCTEVEFSFNLFFALFWAWVLFVGVFLHLISAYLHINMKERAPEWVKENEELKAILSEKLEKNRFSKKWRNYIIKPWTSHLKLEFVSWKAIEDICQTIQLKIDRSQFDMVVGITTGGAFVGYYMSKRLNLPYFSMRSKFWSETSFYQNWRQFYKFAVGINQTPRTGVVSDEVRGKRILLIDDTTYTGITINGIKKKLLNEGGAKSVNTFVMWCSGHHPDLDYFYSKKRIPIIWEWGAEVD